MLSLMTAMLFFPPNLKKECLVDYSVDSLLLDEISPASDGSIKKGITGRLMARRFCQDKITFCPDACRDCLSSTL